MKFQYHGDSGNETKVVQITRNYLQFTDLVQDDLYDDPRILFVHRLHYRDIMKNLDHKLNVVNAGDPLEIIDYVQKRAKGSFWIKHRGPKYGKFAKAMSQTDHFFDIHFKRKEDALMCMMRFKDVGIQQ